MLVFAHRFRAKGQTNNPVRADTVDKALLAVGKGLADLGCQDPRKAAPGSRDNHPLLAAYLKRLSDQDSPTSRTYPANITILLGLLNILDFDDPVWGVFNAHVVDLIVVAFYWLLRPAEYLHSPDAEGRSQAF